MGEDALRSNTIGIDNTAVGKDAMFSNTTGSFNTALGEDAGRTWTTGDYNIAIGANVFGSSSDSGVIRIGGGGLQTKAFIEGISGVNVSSAAEVFINSSDQLGTVASSARFKQDIHDLEGVSDRLRALRPVSFRYKEDVVELPEGEANPLEYGLIAEEVAEIFPELVLNDDQGKPYTVRYHLLTPLLLAEIQRQEGAISAQSRQLESLLRQIEERDRDHRRELADLQRRLDRLAKKKRFR